MHVLFCLNLKLGPNFGTLMFLFLGHESIWLSQNNFNCKSLTVLTESRVKIDWCGVMATDIFTLGGNVSI